MSDTPIIRPSAPDAPPAEPATERWLTAREAMSVLGVAHSTLYAWVEKGVLPCHYRNTGRAGKPQPWYRSEDCYEIRDLRRKLKIDTRGGPRRR